MPYSRTTIEDKGPIPPGGTVDIAHTTYNDDRTPVSHSSAVVTIIAPDGSTAVPNGSMEHEADNLSVYRYQLASTAQEGTYRATTRSIAAITDHVERSMATFTVRRRPG